MTKSSLSFWAETFTGEMLLFRLIGRILYTYPDNKERAWIQSLIDENVFSEAPFAANKDETKAGLFLLQNFGENCITDDVFERIQADYTRLFIGPGKVIAAPWESVYLGDERLTFQEQTLDVRRWYRRFGLEAEKVHNEPDDHIGLELLFLSHLAVLGLKAHNDKENPRFDELLDAQRGFLGQHLGVWALTWCELVEKNALTDFYKGMALLTCGAISALSEVLDVDLLKDVDR